MGSWCKMKGMKTTICYKIKIINVTQVFLSSRVFNYNFYNMHDIIIYRYLFENYNLSPKNITNSDLELSNFYKKSELY